MNIDLKNLCPPALVYFVISIIALGVIFVQNLGNKNNYVIGSFSCRVPDIALVFIVKLIYIVFWTWVLNLICKDGYTGFSWLLVLFPFLLLFVIIGLIMLNSKRNAGRERMRRNRIRK